MRVSDALLPPAHGLPLREFLITYPHIAIFVVGVDEVRPEAMRSGSCETTSRAP